MFPLVRPSPFQNQLLGKRGKVEAIACASVFGQELGQRHAIRQTPPASQKCLVQCIPRLARSFGNRSRPDHWPFSGSCVMRICPCQDLRDGQRRSATVSLRNPTMLGQHLWQRRLPQSPSALAKRVVNSKPGAVPRVWRWSASRGGPVSSATIVFVGPTKNVPHCQPRQVEPIRYPTLGGQQSGKGRSTPQTSIPVVQGHVHSAPRLTVGISNRTTGSQWPASRPLVVGVRPLEDLDDRVFGQREVIASAAMLRQKSNQGTATTEASQPLTQCFVDRCPVLLRLPVHFAACPVWPVARPLMVRIGPGEDLVNRQRRLPTIFGPDASMIREHFRQRRTPQSSTSATYRTADGLPGVSKRLGNRPARVSGPIAGATEVCVCPNKYLTHSQLWWRVTISHSASGGQNPGERRTASHSPLPVAKGHFDGEPSLPLRIGNRTIETSRPLARSIVMGICPFEDLRNGQLRQRLAVPLPTMFGQQPGQRPARVQAPPSHSQRVIDVAPLFVGRLQHPAARLLRPLTRSLVVRVGPGQDLLHGQGSASHGRLFRRNCCSGSRRDL